MTTSYRLTITREWPMDVGYPSLFRHYRLNVGGTLVKESGGWSLVFTPGTDRLNAAESYYRGGYENVVSAEIAEELTDAGFGDFVEEMV